MNRRSEIGRWTNCLVSADAMLYMLDTNICIHLMRHQPPQVQERFQRLSQGEVVMSAISHAELCHGMELCPDPDRRQAASSLKQLIHRVPVLAFDGDAAAQYGRLAALVRDRRRDALDRLIASHALNVGAILVTNNEADFADYPGLTVENWVRQP